jgi:hypothetical protein
MRVSLFLLSVLLLVFSSCKKSHTVHIKAINAVTGQPYAGLSYSIKGTKTGSDGEKLVFTHSGTLNSNGEASPNIKVNENLTLHVGCDPPPNYCYQKNINFFWDAKTDPSPSFLFEYAECGYLQLKVKNINCIDANDVITFNTLPLNLVGYNNIIPQTKTGCYDNEFIDSQVPYGPWIATWQVTKNGITTNHDSTFYINENQHYYFLLEY